MESVSTIHSSTTRDLESQTKPLNLLTKALGTLGAQAKMVAQKVSDNVTIDGIFEKTLIFTTSFGGGLVLLSRNSKETMGFLSLTGLANATLLGLWGGAHLLRGKTKEGTKCLLGGAFLGAMGLKVMDLVTNRDLLNSQASLYKDQLSDCNALLTHSQTFSFSDDKRILEKVLQESVEKLTNERDALFQEVGSWEALKNKEQACRTNLQECVDQIDTINQRHFLERLKEIKPVPVPETTLSQTKTAHTESLEKKIVELEQTIADLVTEKNELVKKSKTISPLDYQKIKDKEKSCSQNLQMCLGEIEKLNERSYLQRLKAVELQLDFASLSNAKYHITFGTTYVKGNSQRDGLSKLINDNHKKYATQWDLNHRVVDHSLLKDECTDVVRGGKTECVPYWNKIALLRNWLKEPKTSKKDEWYILADDDMPVTNMQVDPNEAIDLLRRGKDSSVIVARDVQLWKDGDRELSVNTGLLLVRKDDKSRDVIEKIWEKRNTRVYHTSSACPTLGTCKNQETLHEQAAMADVLKENRSLIGRVVTVVKPRDTYQGDKEIALNTFKRDGCFIHKKENWGSSRMDFTEGDSWYKDGAWREGDWMGQTAGVPVYGWHCGDYDNHLPPGPIREDMLRIMIKDV